MPIVKKEDSLTLSVKIPRALQEAVDQVKGKAKAQGVAYDPSPAVIRCLQKDIERAEKEVAEAKSRENEST